MTNRCSLGGPSSCCFLDTRVAPRYKLDGDTALQVDKHVYDTKPNTCRSTSLIYGFAIVQQGCFGQLHGHRFSHYMNENFLGQGNTHATLHTSIQPHEWTTGRAWSQFQSSNKRTFSLSAAVWCAVCPTVCLRLFAIGRLCVCLH